jgi:hypothetical protein
MPQQQENNMHEKKFSPTRIYASMYAVETRVEKKACLKNLFLK